MNQEDAMNQTEKAKRFAKLHVKGTPLLLYNAWDAGSAKAILAGGAKAKEPIDRASRHVRRQRQQLLLRQRRDVDLAGQQVLRRDLAHEVDEGGRLGGLLRRGRLAPAAVVDQRAFLREDDLQRRAGVLHGLGDVGEIGAALDLAVLQRGLHRAFGVPPELGVGLQLGDLGPDMARVQGEPVVRDPGADGLEVPLARQDALVQSEAPAAVASL